MFIDSHIHLQDYKSQDVKNVVTNAAQNGVFRFINPSSHPSDWSKLATLAKKNRAVIPAFGIHPWYIDDAPSNWAEKLADMLNQNQAAWVGECGIDRLKNTDTARQINILRAHIELAKKFNRPLIIHSVKADSEMTALFHILPQRTIFHSFTGSAEWGKSIQQHGFFIGLNFSILRKKNAAEILQQLNLQQLLLETDGPYQNIERGVETLPQNLPLLAEEIALRLAIPYQEFVKIIIHNQQKFLGEKS